ncbi:hypothetical protein [Laceyella putida]|uniref:Uncharacterized protein n=1 Tax=Laceyella putida TaxID=110101 RepID=A0ABW2RFR2_9BACL
MTKIPPLLALMRQVRKEFAQEAIYLNVNGIVELIDESCQGPTTGVRHHAGLRFRLLYGTARTDWPITKRNGKLEHKICKI